VGDLSLDKKWIKSPFLIALFFFIVTVVGLYLSIRGASYYLSGVQYGGQEKLAIVRIEGVIAQSEDIIRQLKKHEDDDLVKGILLKLNTPGGGVGASQEIYSEVKRISKSKKIIASIEGIAASGGYYIACAANKIVANPGSITGSIGVIMAFSNLEKLFSKIGLETVVIKSGKHKDIGLPSRTITVEERAILQEVSDDIHSQFIEAVSIERNLDFEKVKSYSDGRIFSGKKAKDLGLVDMLGSQEDALRELKKMVAIKGKVKLVEDKKEKNFLMKLLKGEITELFPSGSLSLYGAHYLWQGGD
jgi:protease-4